MSQPWFEALDRPERPERGTLLIELQTTSGAAASVEMQFRRDVLEVWHHGRLAGVLDRDLLVGWLRDPSVPWLEVDEVMLSIDRMVDSNGRLELTLPDVSGWVLSPADQALLFHRLL